LNGNLLPHPQDNSSATETTMINKANAQIDFNKTAQEIERQSRAYYPWPGIYMQFRGKKIKIIKLKMEEQINPLLPSGNIYQAEKKLMVNCGTGALNLIEIQPEGKKTMNANDFINGYLR